MVSATYMKYRRRIKSLPYLSKILLLLFSFLFILWIFRTPKREISPPARRNVELDPFFEKLIAQDYERIVSKFGAFGSPAYLEDINVTLDDQKEIKARYAMNVRVSDHIPYNRSLPETRPRSCRNRKYDHDLPKASIVIVCHNEPWSTLIRTVVSILGRTDHKFIEEVILVDDASQHPDLDYNFLEKLEYFVRTRLPPFVSLIRSDTRLGVVGARLRGAHVAKGDVLVFLDAHVEANDHWLEPLLDRIKSNPHVVVQPVVDHVHWDHFEYTPFNSAHHYPIGTFTWGGSFEWLEMDVATIRGRKDESDPVANPVMSGGMFAVGRRYFWSLGGYDPQMRGWGSENIEMSIRHWTCGGRIEIVPCSAIGHVFRVKSPIDPKTGKPVHSQEDYGFNLVRTVKVWWDDYERLLFNNRPNLKAIYYGDISGRVKLRAKLGCKSMNWYVENVLRKFDMDRDSRYSGRLKSDAGQCLTFRGRYETLHGLLLLRPCAEPLQSTQYFALSHGKELRREYVCALPQADIPAQLYHVRMRPCAESKRSPWTYDRDRSVAYVRLGRCLDATDDQVVLEPCDPKKPSQRWTFIDNATLNY